MEKEIFKAGIKVDVQKIKKYDNEETNTVYRSQICDDMTNGKIKIEMPTYQGKLILLQLETMYSLVFFSKKGMYECRGKVTNRYKTNNMIIAEVEILSQPKKIQRREYFRMSCIIDAEISRLTSEEKACKEMEELYECRNQKPQETSKCIIVDISGGGARVVTDEKINKEDEILLEFGTIAAGTCTMYRIRAKVVNQEFSNNNGERYELRMEFINVQPKVREELIRYIFETERKKIKNGKS